MFNWLRRRTTSIEEKLRLAEEALVQGNLEQASADYKLIAETWPNVAFAYSRRGRTLLQLGHQSEAACEFNRALQLDPGEPEALYYLGTIAQKHGSEAEAAHLFERAFAPERPYPEAGLRLADASLARGDPLTALGLYNRVLEINSKIAEAAYGYGLAATLLNRPIDAIKAFQNAIAIKPNFPAAKALSILQRQFPISSDRRPRTTRPLICMPIFPPYYRYWLGGQSYLINFARIVSALPKAQRPRIIVAAFWDNEDEIESLRSVFESLSNCDAVIAITNSGGKIVYSKPAIDRMSRHKNKTTGRDNCDSNALMSVIDWTFPILYPLWPASSISGSLFWIPDLQHRYWPSFFSAEEIAGRNRDMRSLALSSAPVVFSSYTARQHFREQFPRQECRTYVWHFVSQPNTVDIPPIERHQAQERFQSLGLPARFYYTPNQFWRHKDHPTLFQSLRQILDRGHDVTFVCTGSNLHGATDDYSHELLALIKRLSLGKNLRLLGVLPRADQIEVMRHCCAVIQPSLFEGWSTVVEDACAIGRKVIASDIPVHREQLGENATFFAARDAGALANAVISLDRKLAPGPDPIAEAAALINLKTRMRKSAQEFLEILSQEA